MEKPLILVCPALRVEQIRPGDITGSISSAAFILADEGFTVNHVSVAHRNEIVAVVEWDEEQELVALVAAIFRVVWQSDSMILQMKPSL